MTFAKKMIDKIFIILFGSIIMMSCLAIPAKAQIEEGEVIDKIVAVVGNEIIMLSDINVWLLKMQQYDPSINPYDEKLREQALNSLIDEKLIVTKAIEDSVVVSDEEIDQRLNHLIAQYEQMYGSKKRIEDIFGMSISQIKYESRDILMKQMLAERLKMRVFGNLSITPHDVEIFFNKMKDSLDEIPAQIEVCHIVKNIDASDDEKEKLLDLAKRIRDSINAGGDFADFANRYSDDRNSAINGGQLGWFAKGQLLPEFEKEAFSLSKGQLSLPVETPFGFHIIETLEKNKDSVRARHILLMPGKANDDVQRAKEILLDVKKKFEEGEDFDKLALMYSDESETKGFGGQFGMWEIDKTPPQLQKILNDMKVGEVSNPIDYQSPKRDGKKALHILYKKSFVDKHKPDFEKDFKYIEELALKNKEREEITKWIAKLRKELYWEIKE
jgi:peptidyl-prolyl cis-trans isomerase SurA